MNSRAMVVWCEQGWEKLQYGGSFTGKPGIRKAADDGRDHPPADSSPFF